MKLKDILTLSAAVAVFYPMTALAQTNGTNSSYSRFGLGLPNDHSQSYNRSMGGVAQGLRSGSRVNMKNPASYSAMDSLTFLFDLGMGLQRTRYDQGSSHLTANNTSFDHVTSAFRVAKNVGMSLGFLPYSRVGYSFTQSQDVTVDPYTGQSITNTYSYDGSGGLNQAYIGAGWQVFKGFSIGANVGFMWGNLNHQVVQSFAENGTTNSSSYNSLSTYYTTRVKTWTGDIGVQACLPLNEKNALNFGATIGLGHKIGGESTIRRTVLSGDTIEASTDKGFSLPMTYSVGAAWEHDKKLTVAADITMEKWSDCRTPEFNPDSRTYSATKGSYTNLWRINAGAEYVPSRYDSRFLRRVNYRLGAYYSTPYIKVPQGGHSLEGPREYGVTAGIGLPIANSHTRLYVLSPYFPSYVNVGVGWSRRDASASGLIDENILSIHIGMTFNERWFMKWKFK
ncbi:MAG: hypothetical protein K6A32_04360 [Bacteroidales bacterium]|nr:hypothetical protein [Bacteroidales bacterium]